MPFALDQSLLKTAKPAGLAGAGGTCCLTNYRTTAGAVHRIIVAPIPVSIGRK